MTGYSDTPLAQKLGLTKASSMGVLHAPEYYKLLLPNYEMATTLHGAFDWLHAFYTNKGELMKEFPELKGHIVVAGQLWISWPKKAARMATDLDENSVRDIGLKNGLVDVNVAAIDERWSGLKFVFRVRDR